MINKFYDNEKSIYTVTGTLEDIGYNYYGKGPPSVDSIKLHEYTSWFYLPNLYECSVDEDELKETRMFTITIPLSDEKNLEKDRYIQVLEIKSDQGMIVSKDDYKTGFLVENIIRYSCVQIIIGISIWLVIYLWKIKDDEFKKGVGNMLLCLSIQATSSRQLLVVRFNGEEKKVYTGDEISFEFADKGEYVLEVIKNETVKHMPFYQEFIHLLIMPIRGLFNLYFDSYVYEWEKDIQPYCIHAIIPLYLQESQTIEMIYGPSKYKNEKWEKGYLKINPDYSMNIEYKPNMNSIQERWKASLRKDLSVIAFAILAILFIIMNMSETLFLRMSEYVMLGYLFVVSVIYIRNICSSYQERLRLEKLFLRRTQDEEDEFRN